jgi:RNA polymerase sigma factor (sigma-70 family)
MRDARFSGMIRYLRGVAAAAAAAGVADARLLERFADDGDESAFELLVWRHGPMVLGVCGRLLRNAHDAEDAFQATFLALARKAGSVGRRGSVGGWLYRVAYRVALEARDRAAKRAAREQPVGRVAAVCGRPDPCAEAAGRELGRALDEEISRLPEHYRVPFVLCSLQGRSNAEAARELGCPVKTVESRLTRARGRLRARLVRRGFPLAGGLSAALLGSGEAAAGVTAPLVAATVRGAVLTTAGPGVAAGLVSGNVLALTEGVLRAMFVTKLKLMAALVLITAAGAGLGGLAYRSQAAEKPGPGDPFAVAQGPRQPTPEHFVYGPQGPAPGGQAAQEDKPRSSSFEDVTRSAGIDFQAAQEDKPRTSHTRIPVEFTVELIDESPESLLRKLDERLRKQAEEQRELAQLLERLNAQLKQQHADPNQRAADARRKKALEAIAKALGELKESAPPGSRDRKLVDDFAGAFRQFQERLGTGAYYRLRPDLRLKPDYQLKPGQTDSGSGDGNVRGVVGRVSKEGFIYLSVGSEAGVRLGQTLHVYRVQPQPKYLGTVTVVETQPQQSVARADKLAEAVRAGDQVASELGIE